MRFTEIGQQLRAFRLESGLRAEEIAARLGVSRAALYRYEKGEVIKLDTIQRLAELLKISPLSLLGIGVEYYNRLSGFLERTRQIEETADQILQLSGALCYLTSSEALDAFLAEAHAEILEQVGADRATLKTTIDQVQSLLGARKRAYTMRRPGIIAMIPADAITRFVSAGVAGGLPLSERLRSRAREVAVSEMALIATLMETEPMGLQFGLLTGGEPNGAFEIIRTRDRASLSVNPFRVDSHPAVSAGVAMVTAADEAIVVHQRVAEINWREAVKGTAAAARVRQLIGAASPAG
ncbi:MAG: helix-turn-helix domain-containing protein [Acetobacteraceae bacterium]